MGKKNFDHARQGTFSTDYERISATRLPETRQLLNARYCDPIM